MKAKLSKLTTSIKKRTQKFKKPNLKKFVKRAKQIDVETIKTRSKHPYAVPVITFLL
jgi:hypothetical protein